MPSEVRFAEVRRFLERHGYTLERISGSHHIFQRPGFPTVNIAVHGNKVKPGYIRGIERSLGIKFR